MELIRTERARGKTTHLIHMSHKNGDYIVCHSQDECSRIAAEAKDIGKNIPFPISYDEFISKDYHAKGIKGFLIDNVDLLMAHMAFPVRVDAISVTVPAKDEPKEKYLGTAIRLSAAAKALHISDKESIDELLPCAAYEKLYRTGRDGRRLIRLEGMTHPDQFIHPAFLTITKPDTDYDPQN